MKKIITILLCSTLLSGCMFIHKMDIEQGNIITPDMISRLHAGMTEAQVKEVMGTPVLLNTFKDNREDYVYTMQPGGGKMTEKFLILTFRGGRLQSIMGNMQ